MARRGIIHIHLAVLGTLLVVILPGAHGLRCSHGVRLKGNTKERVPPQFIVDAHEEDCNTFGMDEDGLHHDGVDVFCETFEFTAPCRMMRPGETQDPEECTWEWTQCQPVDETIPEDPDHNLEKCMHKTEFTPYHTELNESPLAGKTFTADKKDCCTGNMCNSATTRAASIAGLLLAAVTAFFITV
mmetsp:Transcript_19518/g.23399  ORF Transcript_19518/g.23399 Transcript_19518/m.23399 type:complete len:186 (+) Transcript_19518:226-783(+)|eukprot:CAMPEP_0197857348 /NCGR_PEP_ID=MMETSP1438-20131217/30309_1 /TAXON_ID=1461541 /ORGANISM="Pterosperma sp., Strain CCMP1384" /LENGTH=185 /DNA_ID=CAMNT_0043473153 /DNA_START=204 /DNA_END=761 /DNA_ORIENTATION=-